MGWPRYLLSAGVKAEEHGLALLLCKGHAFLLWVCTKCLLPQVLLLVLKILSADHLFWSSRLLCRPSSNEYSWIDGETDSGLATALPRSLPRAHPAAQARSRTDHPSRKLTAPRQATSATRAGLTILRTAAPLGL